MSFKPGTVIGTSDIAGNKTDKNPCPCGADLLECKADCQPINVKYTVFQMVRKALGGK